ncbi:MAG: hypothetical protein ABI630_08825, partial [Betaproteobacteria bacterium]
AAAPAYPAPAYGPQYGYTQPPYGYTQQPYGYTQQPYGYAQQQYGYPQQPYAYGTYDGNAAYRPYGSGYVQYGGRPISGY